jgi:metallophosphoesterase (TIGR00282 family)
MQELIEAGADAVTLGNHAFDQKEALVFIERYPQLIRPINYPKGTPGRGAALLKTPGGADVLVINAMGRIFMGELDDPFRAVDAELTACRLKHGADAIVIDMHAEATSEKQALGYYLDGRVHAVLGTHTHVPTADHSILPGGTAYVTDVGMTGCKESIIGFDREDFLALFTGDWRGISVATRGPVVLNGALVEFDLDARRTTGIEAVSREWKP